MYEVYLNNVCMGIVNNPKEGRALVATIVNPLCMKYAVIVLKKVEKKG